MTTAALAVAVGAALISVPVVRSGTTVPAEPAPAPTLAAPAADAVVAPSPAGALPAVPVPAPAPAEQPLAVPSPGPRLVAAPAPQPAPPVPLATVLQTRVDEALASLGYPWQELGYDIRFTPYTGGLLGLADPATRTITVFVKPTSSVQALRVVLAHEIAHALDERTGSPEQRARYLELRGIPAGTPWFPCDRCEDFDTPAGDFAEVFAAWLVGPTDFRSRMAPLPTPEQLGRIVPLFAPLSSRAAVAGEQAPRPAPSPSRKRDVIDFSPGG